MDELENYRELTKTLEDYLNEKEITYEKLLLETKLNDLIKIKQDISQINSMDKREIQSICREIQSIYDILVKVIDELKKLCNLGELCKSEQLKELENKLRAEILI